MLVGIRIKLYSVNHPSHSCSTSLGYRRFAYQCASCSRIVCRQCTCALRFAARRRSGARRCVSPVCGITGITNRRFPKQPRLSPAAGTAESEVVDTASADEHERAQMADEHEQLSPAAGTAESEVRTTKQQPDPQDRRSQSEVVWEEEKQDVQLRIELLTDALESARSLGRKQAARIEELEREASVSRAFSRR